MPAQSLVLAVGDVGAAFLCCLCWVSPSTRRPLLDAGWGVSAKVASELGVLPTPGGFGLQASVGVWIGHLYCTTDGDCQAEYVTE